jgi:hypothetical protein
MKSYRHSHDCIVLPESEDNADDQSFEVGNVISVLISYRVTPIDPQTGTVDLELIEECAQPLN